MKAKKKHLKQVTVKGLISRLLRMPQNSVVDFEIMEGDDVTGGCAYIYDMDVEDGYVRIFVTDQKFVNAF
jgi:hypothetical protein